MSAPAITSAHHVSLIAPALGRGTQARGVGAAVHLSNTAADRGALTTIHQFCAASAVALRTIV